jgi:hypothetical protein
MATAADAQETLKLETLSINIGSIFFFLVLSRLLLRSNKAKHLAADAAKNGEKTDEMPRVRPSPICGVQDTCW